MRLEPIYEDPNILKFRDNENISQFEILVKKIKKGRIWPAFVFRSCFDSL